MADHGFTPCPPFSGWTHTPDAGHGVIATDLDGQGIASVAGRKGQIVALTERVRERFGIILPRGPLRATAGGIGFAGTSPEIWLATQEKGGNDFAAALREQIGAMAAVADQTDGYAMLRLTGPKLRDTLAKIISIDVHPRTFKPGDVASTVGSHIGATFWRLQDNSDGTPVFEIAVSRSLAISFWHALSQSAAEFGLVVAQSSSAPD
jgi:heterotetrameric sarcosine oxidase gamma subunit